MPGERDFCEQNTRDYAEVGLEKPATPTVRRTIMSATKPLVSRWAINAGGFSLICHNGMVGFVFGIIFGLICVNRCDPWLNKNLDKIREFRRIGT